MTEHFTSEEAVALAKAAGFDVRRGLGLRESVPEMEAAYVDKAEEQDPFRTHWLNRHGYRAMIAAAQPQQKEGE